MTLEAESNFPGMTLNERLFAARLLSEFDTAARQRARATMISLLVKVGLSESDAAASSDAILADPKLYGY